MSMLFIPCSKFGGDAPDLIGALGRATAAAHRHEQPRRDLVNVWTAPLRGLN